MPAQFHRVKEVFLAALEKDQPAERLAYLDAACGPDLELRQQVDALLARHAAAGSFLEAPAADSVPSTRLTPLPVDPPFEGAGTAIGSYKLMEQIGEGGMGLVFVAEQQHPVRRKVALKIIKPGMDTREIVARFEAERQALALMDHPNIAKVHDGGATGSGRPYFVMELVKGVPITNYCDQNQVPIRERLELFVSVCHAIQHAHQKGIIHRDLKPSNVLVMSQDGTPLVKVIDFGVAKAVGQQLTDKTVYTQFAQLVGTPLYMSPEQAGQSSLDVDTRSDIYSLGVLLYELLTGTTPVDKERLKRVDFDELRRIIREDEPPKPSTRISSLSRSGLPSRTGPARQAGPTGGPNPTTVEIIAAQRKSDPKQLSRLCRGELDWIVMKALEKDRNRRYETANELAMDLQRYLHDEPVQACPPSAAYRFRKMVRRNKALFATATAMAATLLVASGAVTWKWYDAETARQDEQSAKEIANAAEKQARDDRHRSVHAERLARLREAEALVGQAHGIRLSRRQGQRFDALAALAKAAAIARELDVPTERLDRLREEAIACLALPDARPLLPWREGGTPANEIGAQFDGNLEHWATYDDQRGTVIRRVSDNQEVNRLPKREGFRPWRSHVLFSPSGRFLSVHHHLQGGVGIHTTVWNWREGRPLFDRRRQISWLADDRFAIFDVESEDSPIIFDANSGREEKRLSWIKPTGCWLHFDRISQRVALVSNTTGEIRVVEADSGKSVTKFTVPKQNLNTDWSSDGRLLAVGGETEGRIYVWDVAAGRLQAVLEGQQGGVILVCFHPKGHLLLSHGKDGLTRLWDPVSGDQLLRLTGFGKRFSPDGSRLALARGTQFATWELTDGREYRTLHHGRVGSRDTPLKLDGPKEVTFSPDGRFLASCADDGVRLWDLRTDQEVAHLSIGATESVRFDPKGGNLLTIGDGGFLRRPIAQAGEGLLIGPPQRIAIPVTREMRLQHWGKGEFLAAVVQVFRQVHVIDPPDPSRRKALLDQRGKLLYAAASPDGRWVAGALSYSAGDPVTVWDTSVGKQVYTVPVTDRNAAANFSPDGQWLGVAERDKYRFWRVGTWEAGVTIFREKEKEWPSPLAFTSDGRLVALALAPWRIALVEPASGQQVAVLSPPEPWEISWLCFSPDNTKLAVGRGKQSIQIWDLHRLRGELAKIGLDWDAQRNPLADENNTPAR
jgi:serine/threonine protein kinase/WD40 repeat protein